MGLRLVQASKIMQFWTGKLSRTRRSRRRPKKRIPESGWEIENKTSSKNHTTNQKLNLPHFHVVSGNDITRLTSMLQRRRTHLVLSPSKNPLHGLVNSLTGFVMHLARRWFTRSFPNGNGKSQQLSLAWVVQRQSGPQYLIAVVFFINPITLPRPCELWMSLWPRRWVLPKDPKDMFNSHGRVKRMLHVRRCWHKPTTVVALEISWNSSQLQHRCIAQHMTTSAIAECPSEPRDTFQHYCFTAWLEC